MLKIIDYLNSFIWGYFIMFLLVGVGLYLTIRMGFIQFRFFKHALSLLTGKWESKDDDGEISHFKTLSTALSATVGTGNIAGVATAIASGGPGAVFWMWVTAFLGMCTKACSCILAMKYREIDKNGEVSGGPMYYLKNGLKLPWLGLLFAIFTVIAAVFGIGNLVQANSVAEPLYDTFGIPKILTGVFLSILTGFVILGGVKRIADFASKVVPFMAAVYFLSAIIILFTNIENIPHVFKLIFGSAFGLEELGGGVLGFTVSQAMRFGVARGLFSNEAGLGSAPIAHAATKTKEPVRVGIVAMLEPFIDTIVICSMTAFVIISSGLYESGVSGTSLTSMSFDKMLPGFGSYLVVFAIIFFAFTTLVTWSYYGDRSIKYIFHKNSDKAVKIYRWFYILIIPLGASTSLNLIWKVADIANGFMIIPNLVGVVGLSFVVKHSINDYSQRLKFMKPNK